MLEPFLPYRRSKCWVLVAFRDNQNTGFLRGVIVALKGGQKVGSLLSLEAIKALDPQGGRFLP